jgi:putative transcriptional regulator
MSIAGESIIKGALEALEFAQGKENGCVAHIPNDIDVCEIRASMHMTQKQFSRQFGLSTRTLQDWEQGRRNPTGVSKVLLQVLAKEPDAVIRALQG